MKLAIGRFAGAAALALGSVLSWPAAAAVVTLTPASVTPTPGSAVLVDVRVSELGAGNALGGFDLDVGYNQALLSFNSVAFGSALGNPAASEALTSVSMAGPGVLD